MDTTDIKLARYPAFVLGWTLNLIIDRISGQISTRYRISGRKCGGCLRYMVGRILDFISGQIPDIRYNPTYYDITESEFRYQEELTGLCRAWYLFPFATVLLFSYLM